MKSFCFAAALAFAGALGACATAGLAPAKAAQGAGAPKGEVPLGDYAAGEEAKLAVDFSSAMASRYPKGLPLKLAVADLERSKFTCAPPGKSKAGGDPPNAVCRRAIAARTCTHTWQVHLFDDDAGHDAVARVRGLYDKTCGEELLGR